MTDDRQSLTDLLEHREAVPATMPLEEVFHRFSENTAEFMAVLATSAAWGSAPGKRSV
jgi:hypothetical protein